MNHAEALSKPHDTLFKRSMQEQQVAIDLLIAALPATLLAEIDLTTLTAVTNDHLLDGLEVLQSDCVCRCHIRGETGYLFIGTEHQSSDDEMMAFRTLRYAVGIMNNHLRSAHQKLPIVISLVLYHGIKTPYPHSPAIWDCFAQPELAKQWALQPFHLIDLTVLSDEAIEGYSTAAAMGMLFKHYREERLTWLKKMLLDGVLDIIRTEIGSDYLADIGKYIIKVCGSDQYPEDRYQALEILKQVDPEVGKEIMTFAQQFRQEGLQQGMTFAQQFREEGLQQGMSFAQQFREEGLQQGMSFAQQFRKEGLQQGMQQERFKIAKHLLKNGVSQQLVKLSTGLSDQEIADLCLS